MRFDVLSVIQNLSSTNILWIVIVVGILVPVFILWRDLKREKKDEYFRTEHVFDFVCFSFLFGIILARISYMALNWDIFREVRWFWIPYEKIEEQVMWLESFPWIFFKMGINTVLIEGFAIGLIAGINFTRGIHHLSWKRVSVALADFVGLFTAFGCWAIYIYTKQELLVYPILILFILFIMKELTKESFDMFRKLTLGIWKFVASISLAVILSIRNLRVGFCCILSWNLLFVVILVILSLVFMIRIMFKKKKKIEKEPMRFEKKRIPTKIQKRSYTLSYRTLSGKWWNKLISRFHSSDEDSTGNQ
ncbi:MAG: hypothetical protein ABIC57_03470 [bacterium]